MKRMITVWLIVLTTALANAQTFDEWFRQKKTQIKYLQEQITALKGYGALVNKGYDIAQNGLTSIFNSKDEDHKQHDNYFNSLWKVKPDIRSYSKIVSIFQMKNHISNQSRVIRISVTNLLNSQEKDYINKVFESLRVECGDLIREINLIINDDQLQLKDNERIERIDKIYAQMQDRYQFAQSFVGQIKLLTVNRLKAGNETDKLSSYYGLK